MYGYVGTGWNEENPSEPSICFGLLSGVYSLCPCTFSGVPSLGGVGGKLNELDATRDVDGCTERGAVGEG